MNKIYMCNSFFDFEVFTAHNIRHYYCVLYFCDINVITTLRKLNQYQNNQIYGTVYPLGKFYTLLTKHVTIQLDFLTTMKDNHFIYSLNRGRECTCSN